MYKYTATELQCQLIGPLLPVVILRMPSAGMPSDAKVDTPLQRSFVMTCAYLAMCFVNCSWHGHSAAQMLCAIVCAEDKIVLGLQPSLSAVRCVLEVKMLLSAHCNRQTATSVTIAV